MPKVDIILAQISGLASVVDPGRSHLPTSHKLLTTFIIPFGFVMSMIFWYMVKSWQNMNPDYKLHLSKFSQLASQSKCCFNQSCPSLLGQKVHWQFSKFPPNIAPISQLQLLSSKTPWTWTAIKMRYLQSALNLVKWNNELLLDLKLNNTTELKTAILQHHYNNSLWLQSSMEYCFVYCMYSL